jgi:hypothetical protein
MKKTLILIGKFAVSAVLIAVAARGVDLTELRALAGGAEPLWLAGSLVLLSCSYVLGAAQWHLILRVADIPVSFPKTVGLYYVGLFFNNFLIGGMGGDLLRVYDIRKHQGENSLSPALATVFVDRFTGLLALLFLACIVGTFVIGKGSMLYLAITMILSLWIFLIVLLFYKPLAEKIIKPFVRWLPAGLYERFQRLYFSVNRFRLQPWRLLRAFLIAIGVQFLRILSIWCIGRALGDSSALFYYLIFVPIISLAASLPISIGGTGPREQTTVLLFKRIGVARELAFSIGLVTYGMSLLSTLPGVVIFLIRKNTSAYAESPAL